MSTINLQRLFNPKSVAVIGASEKSGSVGCSILKNLVQSGFKGDIFPVNPKYKRLMGLACLSSVQEIVTGADLAVIATPIRTAPELVEACGQKGFAGAVIVSSGGREIGEKGQKIEARIMEKARQYNMRIIGPNCLGIVNTSWSLNASFAHLPPLPGKIAFLSQSGAVCTSVLDMALRENVGFSHFVSLGSMVDVDFADMIDYLGSLSSVRSIVMYMENITHIRNFMSAARSVSRLKPIIVLKSGRSKAGARAAASHTGAMAGEDAVYDAAFERAGILRVAEFEELFDCTEFLAKQRRPSGPGLTIITNAGGPGVMAADALASHGMEPAILGPETRARLDLVLPENWSRDNPIDILGDTDPGVYLEAAKICANAPETNALLLICSPAGTMDGLGLAKALSEALKSAPCPVFAAWIGGANVDSSRQVFNQAGIVTYDSAERAVRAFKNLYQYGKNIELLHEIPVRTDTKLRINRENARQIISQALATGASSLMEDQAKELLSSYGIPSNRTLIADTREMAVALSEQMGFPVVLKICSNDILHKSDCNGVALDLKTAESVRAAFDTIVNGAKNFAPEADIKGVSVQAMQKIPDLELIIGAKKDDKFGPVILFGTGGVLTEVFQDTSMGLPPLNRLLARQMIERTKISRAFKGFRNIPEVGIPALEELLIRTGRLVTDFPEITALDINPLMVKDGTMVAVDARVLIAPAKIASPLHLIIGSYPWQYESTAATIDGHDFFIRPIRPSDADLLIDHFGSLSHRSIYMRFFSPLKQLSRDMVIRLTQIDYDREIALVALMGNDRDKKIAGVSRIITYSDGIQAEFALAISDEWQGKGIGAALLTACLKAARQKGIKRVMGLVLAENTQMLKLGKKLGFKITRSPESSEYELIIEYNNMNVE
ncbi:MAG: bifunctional acetate--CoA ligase family protein/GNAT family N-acetyltransferase [Proteobacteria bacterium]|nr:bifunctional acetate--CoA ligase family protein/GNAT family N-acetyltransferase [Pseudomonadota bacterium]